MSLCTDPRPLQERQNLSQVPAIRPGDTLDLKLDNACQERCSKFPDLLKPEMRCKLAKCAFAQPSVEYLGHVLSRQGIAEGPKVDAVLKMHASTDVSSLRSFLGSVQFYGKLSPNLATCTQPLSRLRRSNTPWRWGTEEQDAFQRLKDALCTD